jgi:hypothetical protein
MQMADTLVLHDAVLLNTRSYTRRCFLPQAESGELLRLSVPLVKGSQNTLIRDVSIDHSSDWVGKHLKSLRHNYAKSSQFERIFPWVSALLESSADTSSLVQLNVSLIAEIGKYLDINTPQVLSSDYQIDEAQDTDAKHIELVRQCGGRTYLSGEGGRTYQNPQTFAQATIDLVYVQSLAILEAAVGRPRAGVSIIDYLFNYSQVELVTLLQNSVKSADAIRNA